MCLFKFLISNSHVKDEIMLLPALFHHIHSFKSMTHFSSVLQHSTDNLITSHHELKAHKINKNYLLELPIDFRVFHSGGTPHELYVPLITAVSPPSLLIMTKIFLDIFLIFS